MAKESKVDVLIIGGGASGMTAAITARRLGAEVLILERNSRIGKKILATGNGRCNYTNINTDIKHFNGKNPKFIYSALKEFNVQDTINFFEELGVAHKVEDLGKVFPMSDQASSVLDVLRFELEDLGVKISCDSYVKNIEKIKDIFKVVLEDGSAYTCKKVIIAAGGKAKPSTGSDGNGFDLAKKLGHTIEEIFPGLVQLKLEGNYFKQINGVKIIGTVELFYENKLIASDKGDILFANYGVSGPPVLQISRKAAELIELNKKAVIKIKIIDSMSTEEVDSMLIKRFNNMPKKTIEKAFIGLINKRLIPVILKEAGIKDLKCMAANLKSEERKRIAEILTGWKFIVKGTKSWPSAQVTAGGIDTREINPNTMESKKVKGLYFAGEIMDIDGECGGYNLQWAWSSGYVAGKNACEKTKSKGL